MITAKIEGLSELQQQMQDLARNLVEALPLALEAATDVLAKEIKARTPVQTGALRGALTKQTTVEASQLTGKSELSFGAQSDKARAVEFGRTDRHTGAHPFIRPGFTAGKEAALAAFTQTLAEELGP